MMMLLHRRGRQVRREIGVVHNAQNLCDLRVLCGKMTPVYVSPLMFEL
jgi:hypothetical protein